MSGPDRARKVPGTRLSRLAALGQIAGGIAVGMAAEGASRLARGERPHLRDLILTPSNARKTAEQLSRMRGAAMKLGQMISLEPDELLPPEIQAIFAQLRNSAHAMPAHQLVATLARGWGHDWRQRFQTFDMTPMAAASIGQVHRAVLADGRPLAVKVQFPGIAASIESDIDNVATLLRMTSLVPPQLDITPHLRESKRQLHEEADYLREAEQMRAFAALLQDDPRFVIPTPIDDLLTPTILPMSFAEGWPLETLASASQDARDRAMTALADLTLKELFVFGRMQTDPNFANYLWRPEDGRIVLLDFGAVRPVAPESAASYRRLLQAAMQGEVRAVRDALRHLGFLSPAQDRVHDALLASIVGIALEQFLHSPNGLVDFGDRGALADARERALTLFSDRSMLSLPAPDLLFLQRKIGGLALLAVKLQARLPLPALLRAYA